MLPNLHEETKYNKIQYPKPYRKTLSDDNLKRLGSNFKGESPKKILLLNQ
jgi:hypothetical protein